MSATLLLEPAGRNTVPALTLAALQAAEDGPAPILVVMPADQTVQRPAAFQRALQQSIRAAADGSIVILCITPDKPEQAMATFSSPAQQVRMAITPCQFAEMPSLEVAQAYLAGGQHMWNSGMFVLRAAHGSKPCSTFTPRSLRLHKLRGKNVCVLDCGELPRSLRHVCL